jgi:hypothetical protein
MPLGPGKYDPECAELRARLKADGLVVLVFGGEHGHGFSAQLPFDLTMKVPDMLREIAKQIEADIPELRQQMLDSVPKA